MTPPDLSEIASSLAAWSTRASTQVRGLSFAPRLDHVGTVASVGDGVAFVHHLPDVRRYELLMLDTGEGRPLPALAVTLDEQEVGCFVLGRAEAVRAGARAYGTGQVLTVPVGNALLGRIVDPLGRPLDGGAALDGEPVLPVERPAPAIIDRDFVRESLRTGITAIDAMIPLGRGQRELIIGDRQTGKTAIALDTIINQKHSDVVCVYAAVGQRSSAVIEVIEAVRRYGAPDRCVFVIADSDDPPGLQWVLPFAACAIAEAVAENGGDALLVLDDLSKHALIHRQLSLLLRQPPGREAYPGDVFYLHSRLLERGAKLSAERGGGSLTILPIAETQAGNIAAYIPTNLISITDGQVVCDPKLFRERQKPAINIGLSVSRVGGKTQSPAMRQVADRLKLDYSQFLELETFARLGGLADDAARARLEHGRRLRTVLSQRQYAPFGLGEQIAILVALQDGVLDRLAIASVDRFRAELPAALEKACPGLLTAIDRDGRLGTEDRARLSAAITALAQTIDPPHDPAA